MSKSIQIKKGLDIKLKGSAEKTVGTVDIREYALKPTDFNGVIPKLLLKVGDKVKAGTIVFYDKKRGYLKFSSPVSGTITEVIRGEKRKMLEIRIESDGKMDSEKFATDSISALSREKIIERMLESGFWPMVIQRPYGVIANPKDKPKSIFISAFDSAPLAVDMDLIVEGKNAEFQAGLDVLKKLTDGKIHLNIHANNTKSKVFLDAKGVEINKFSGPHPAGIVGVQIAKIDPINKGDIIWTLDPQSVIILGKLFKDGIYNPEKIVAIAGSEVKNPKYFKLISGANISKVVDGNINKGELRFISGNVLTGTQIEKNGYLSFYHQSINIIPEGNFQTFFGWLIPSPKKHSFYHTAFSWLTPNKEYSLNTNLNGGERAFVVTGAVEKVFPMDIYLIPLLKAVLAGDIDKMEKLGIYEVIEEDIALCEYISTSKINMQSLLRTGLDLMYVEMS